MKPMKQCDVCYRRRKLSLHNGLNLCKECKNDFLNIDKVTKREKRDNEEVSK